MTDETYMRRALELAEKGAGWVSPNPLVGAVIVKDEEIIGEGYHEQYGQLHAERNALAHCTKSPKGHIGAVLPPRKTAAVYRCPACRRNPQGGDWVEGSKPSGTWKRHSDFAGAWCGSDRTCTGKGM